MKRPPVILFGFAVTWFLFTPAGTAHAGDNLAERTVLTSSTEFPASGTTAGKTGEPGEVNESREPASASDRSAWYEWTPEDTGIARLKAEFITSGSRPARGLAAYTLADGSAGDTMAELIPAGAVVLPAATEDRSMQLWVAAGQKVILRVWTSGSTGSLPFIVSLAFQPKAQREAGDLPETAIPLPVNVRAPDGATGSHFGIGIPAYPFPIQSTEAADNWIGGRYYPSGAVFWYRWQPGRSENVRLSLRSSFDWPTAVTIQYAKLMVVERSTPGGPLNPVAGPADTLTLTPEANKEYLLRVSLSLPDDDALFEGLDFLSGPVPAGDDYTAPLFLAPEGSLQLFLAGAKPAAEPDIWIDLGSALSGVFDLKASDVQAVTVYRAQGSGPPGTYLFGNSRASELTFVAEAGHHYFVRVSSPNGVLANKCTVSLSSRTLPPPENDLRSAAVVLPSAGLQVVFGDATGASAEESDWPGGSADADRSISSVWYALDLPAGEQLWFVWAWDGGKAEIFHDQNGGLRPAGDSWNRFTPDGGRLWIKIAAKSRFVIMAGPAVTPGDDLSEPMTLIPGETHFVYAGAATANSPAPGLAGPETMWFSWTAEESGTVVLSTQGSPSAQWKPAVFTAALEPVPTMDWTPIFQGDSSVILSFEAAAGSSYRIVLDGNLRQPAVVRLKPGGWESPYELYVQNHPAWQDVTSLQDPLADADGDGVCNLMEMAVGGHLVSWQNYSGWPFIIKSDPPGLELGLQVRTPVLRGAPGSTPFKFVVEGSRDLSSWVEMTYDVIPGEWYDQHHFVWPSGAVDDPPVQYFRCRVSR
jgi:hypothetical protein